MNTGTIIQKLTADKKKLGVMLMLVAVLCVVWGRMVLKNGPKTASATVDKLVQPMVPTDNVMTDELADAVKALPVVLIDDHGPVSRDLFAFDASYFTAIDGGNASVEGAGKSPSDSTDENTGTRAVEMAVRAAAGGLKLQTTLLGQSNRAMINGEVLEEGQEIQGFVLKEVRSRLVRLEKDGVTVTLEM